MNSWSHPVNTVWWLWYLEPSKREVKTCWPWRVGTTQTGHTSGYHPDRTHQWVPPTQGTPYVCISHQGSACVFGCNQLTGVGLQLSTLLPTYLPAAIFVVCTHSDKVILILQRVIFICKCLWPNINHSWFGPWSLRSKGEWSDFPFPMIQF